MGMPAPLNTWTAERAAALPDDGNRYEVVDGELLVTPAPAPRHQAVLVRLFRILDPYILRHSIGWLFWSPAGIRFSPTRAVQPDLFVVPDRGQGPPEHWGDVKGLLLAVEALSPTTARADRLVKRPMYQAQRVPEYWIVDIDSRIVERWRPGDERPEVTGDVLSWHPVPDVPPLDVKLTEVFGPPSSSESRSW